MRLGLLDKNRLKYPGGRGVLPMMAYTGRLARNGYLFQASSIWKGRDFTCWSILIKSREICHLSLWKGPKGLTDEFYGLLSRENVLFLWLISIERTVHLQQLKEMQSRKQGKWKGHHLSIEGIWKGYLFRENGTSKGNGLDLGAEPPRINVCWVPRLVLLKFLCTQCLD